METIVGMWVASRSEDWSPDVIQQGNREPQSLDHKQLNSAKIPSELGGRVSPVELQGEECHPADPMRAASEGPSGGPG